MNRRTVSVWLIWGGLILSLAPVCAAAVVVEMARLSLIGDGSGVGDLIVLLVLCAIVIVPVGLVVTVAGVISRMGAKRNP